ncbi:MAG: glycosyltransferase [Chloroflexota bacterium]|nr:glycosyltransferase [Chloroflexota bacterium]
MGPLKILIWGIHGSYLNTLVHIPHQWYLPVKPDRPEGYGGMGRGLLKTDHVCDVPAEEVSDLDLDLVIFQTPKNYFQDQFEILSPEQQQKLPKIYLQHNVPKPHATDTRHPVDDPSTLLVHVTHYNRLMWDNNRTPTVVIEHSVAIDPRVRYQGHLERGITVINSMPERGRALGHDLFIEARKQIPLDIAGFGNEGLNPIGDFAYQELHFRVAEYRFLYSPIRYTSLPLSVIEALHIGMPVVALATTELPTVIENGVHGYISCEPDELIERMRHLLAHPAEARRLGENARTLARDRFNLERFTADWNRAFERVLS